MEKVQGINMTIVDAVAQTLLKAIEEVNTEPGRIEVERVSVGADGLIFCNLKNGIEVLGDLSGNEVREYTCTKQMDYLGLRVLQPIKEDEDEFEIV